MQTLNLNLKKKWFDMTLAGIKKEEYREIKPFWISRLTKLVASDVPAEMWMVKSMLTKNSFFFRGFVYTRFINGMAKDAPVFTIQNLGIRIGTGNPEWGAEPGKEYFIISHGEVLETRNIKPALSAG